MINLRASLNKGLPKRLLLEFPNTNPVTLSEIPSQDIISDWVTGFTDGEGCFFVKVSKSKTHKLGLNFVVVQNIKNIAIMEKIKSKLGCGSITINERSAIARYTVAKLSDIQNIIIPFFDKYSLISSKANKKNV